MKYLFQASIALATALTLTLSSCGSTGRVRGEGEEQLVGDKKAGIITYDELVKQSTTKLVAQAGMQSRAQGPYRVAFFGLETKGAEELRDNLPAIYEQIEEILVNSGPFVVQSRKAVDRARQEAGLRDFDDLFIAKNRDKFMGIMGRDSQAPDILVYGTTTTQSTESSGGWFSRDTKEARYMLSLEMIDAATGTILSKVSGKQEIEYKK
jgi:curli biogenesis system outer membrane secretion channel CsgG